MKAAVLALILLVLCSSLALAQEVQPEAALLEEPSEELPEEFVDAMPKSLMISLTRAKNDQAREQLQSNLQSFHAQYQGRLGHMTHVHVAELDEETGAVTIEAKETVKYLGFIKGKATKRFTINAQGAVSEHAPWYRFLYAETYSK